jgi:glycosyltransferase involved in cell wall biosynthesis
VPRLSIIIATYNAAATLTRCLRSIVSQTSREWQIVVADGGSTDGTQDILSKHNSEIAYWQSRPDAGIYDAWNQALKHATGEYVCFLGADDSLRSEQVLERIFSAIGRERYDLVSSRCLLVDASGRSLDEFGGAWDYARLPRRMGIAHPGLLHRRDLFSRYGCFDKRLKIAGDLDFLLRLPEDTRTLHLPIVSINVQNDGISRKQFWRRLHERRLVHARCNRVGSIRANVFWLDKALRMPIAKLFGLPH